MVAPAAEQPGRFNAEIGDLLRIAVHRRRAVGQLFFGPLLLDHIFLILAHRLTLLGLLLIIDVQLLEITLRQILDRLALLRIHHFAPVVEEVLVEHVLFGVVVVQHAGVEAGDFLCRRTELIGLVVVAEVDRFRQRVVVGREEGAGVLQEAPFGAVGAFLLLPPFPFRFFLLLRKKELFPLHGRMISP